VKKTVEELASLVDGSVRGDEEISIQGIAGICSAREGQITFLSNGKYRDQLQTTRASAIVLSHDDEARVEMPSIRVDNPDLAFARIARVFEREDAHHPPGIHESAVVSDHAEVHEEACIEAHVTVEDGARIEKDAVIMAGSYIGRNVTVGPGCRIFPNVNVMEETELGERVIIHSSSVIGCDGFGYVKEQGDRKKIPQLGRVVVEDEVEIGSSVTIDRARFDETRICRGAKIDNLVQIAHNVTVGENAVIVAQSGIAGSSSVGKNSMLGGQSGVAGHLEVGDNVKVAGRAGVTKDVEEGEVVSGFPAQPRSKFNRKQVMTRKLPALAREIEELKEQVDHLQEELDKDDSKAEDDSGDR